VTSTAPRRGGGQGTGHGAHTWRGMGCSEMERVRWGIERGTGWGRCTTHGDKAKRKRGEAATRSEANRGWRFLFSEKVEISGE
jgi:hypothetical protein